MADIRTAIIGTGLIANSAHLTAIKRIGKGFNIIACCDMRENAALETAERFHIPDVYRNHTWSLPELCKEGKACHNLTADQSVFYTFMPKHK